MHLVFPKMAAATLLLLQTNRVSPFSSLIIYPTTNSNNADTTTTRQQTLLCSSFSSSSSLYFYSKVSLCVKHRNKHNHSVFSSLPPPPPTSSSSSSSSSSSFRSARNASTKLYVSGLVAKSDGKEKLIALQYSSATFTKGDRNQIMCINDGRVLLHAGLSFRTTEESLTNAFKNFGQLKEVNLVMDKIANRPRGFAFLRYETEEESKKAIEGMHGKFLDGRVIFVEVAKPKWELRNGI